VKYSGSGSSRIASATMAWPLATPAFAAPTSGPATTGTGAATLSQSRELECEVAADGGAAVGGTFVASLGSTAVVVTSTTRDFGASNWCAQRDESVGIAGEIVVDDDTDRDPLGDRAGACRGRARCGREHQRGRAGCEQLQRLTTRAAHPLRSTRVSLLRTEAPASTQGSVSDLAALAAISTACAQARAVSAMYVSEGFATPSDAIAAPSVTSRFGTSCAWFQPFSTDVFGSRPMRAPPISWIASPARRDRDGSRCSRSLPRAPFPRQWRVMSGFIATSFGRR
jgi:hypothetical protein